MLMLMHGPGLNCRAYPALALGYVRFLSLPNMHLKKINDAVPRCWYRWYRYLISCPLHFFIFFKVTYDNFSTLEYILVLLIREFQSDLLACPNKMANTHVAQNSVWLGRHPQPRISCTRSRRHSLSDDTADPGKLWCYWCRNSWYSRTCTGPRCVLQGRWEHLPALVWDL